MERRLKTLFTSTFSLSMQPTSIAFLKSLLDSPGPSGFESAPARLWRHEAETFADEVSADIGGNSHASVNLEGRRRLMFAGHIDEIGLMVTHVDDEGFVYFDTIGGWDSQVFVGQRVLLLGKSGPVHGVIGKKAIHLMEKEDRDKVSKVSDLWVDIGAKAKAEAQGRIRVGDAGVLAAQVQEFPGDRLVSRSLDNRVGAFVVLEALRLLARDRPTMSVTAVATSQEEIAYTGGGARTSATGLAADIAIVVDVTHATDCPGIEKKQHGDVKLGGGPVLSRGSAVNNGVFDALVRVAEADGIPYTLQAAPRDTGTDADAIFTAHRGIATGLVSVPLRYMHSPNEMVALSDIDHAARLLAGFARSVGVTTDFVPR
jgi:putative aminopeptidase FrvX